MADVVVTVPMTAWEDWIAEGQLPGDEWDGETYSYFSVPSYPRRIIAGERVYVVAGGRLRGFAPLVRVEHSASRCLLVRACVAVAMTTDETITGFRGYRYRWWDRANERPFVSWRDLRVEDV